MGTEAAHGPLEELRKLLDRGPPRLSALLSCFGEAEGYTQFVCLVREFLPDREHEILNAGDQEEMVLAFVGAFEERYFPLDGMGMGFAGEEFDSLLYYIPVGLHGLDEDDYHFMTDWKPSHILGALLVDFEGEMAMCGQGIRTTLMEVVEGTFSREALERLPVRGYSLDFLRAETPPELVGLVRIAEYVCHSTGCFFMDATYEDLCGDLPNWDREVVEFFVEHWAINQRIDVEINKFEEWIEESPEARFRELVRFLERRASGRRARIHMGAAPRSRGLPRQAEFPDRYLQ